MRTRQTTPLAVVIFFFQQLSWSFVPIPSRKSWLAKNASGNGGLAWSRQVEQASDDTFVWTDLSHHPSGDTVLSSKNLQSPREWLEYCELIDGQEGAYTVMRCDYYPSTKKWIRWGEIFHKERLMTSSQLLLQSISLQPNSSPIVIEATINATNHIVESLLSAASVSMEAPLTSLDDQEAITVMITILWTPTLDQRIKVRGHAFHTGQVSSPGAQQPTPIVVNIATGPFPNRYQHTPQAKLSSWCRRRVPLEEQFKLSGIGEVILTRDKDGKDLELLEGLTSNLFVVFRDGSLHTPSEDLVLGGFARQLVLDHAKECGLHITIGPLNLSTVSEWKDVFVTSAIKVITPVEKIVRMHRLQDGTWTTESVWTGNYGVENEIWHVLLSRILRNYC